MERHLRYIAIEGLFGSGKTDLAKFMGGKLRAKLVLEDIDNNPFLPSFYEDREKFALPTQLFFLLTRHSQQRSIAQMELFNQNVVSDYLFNKDRIFAYHNLNESEIALYERIYEFIKKDIPTPTLVIYLQLPPEYIFSRVRNHGREFEKEIDYQYILSLSEAYNRFFFHYIETPLLIVHLSQNPNEKESLRETILDEVIRFKGYRRILSLQE
ncbi:deoxynucleoside kinase [candidate division WOR-3 bacterium]|uniref:Deoxynucleoside kinase n=1 Tax=candidate division WOR-3 bacterium TaxID=2052148 RepID=A0A660SJ90_UNCW3|nr:MAG: deoxynucleoside kinase [candidate division WOR-3 bacterium]